MAPALAEGQTVLVRHTDNPRPGDVALLDVRGVLEIHRLLDRIRAGRRTWYVHAGDASDVCGVAGGGDILGIVSAGSRPRIPLHARLLGLRIRARALLCLLTR